MVDIWNIGDKDYLHNEIKISWSLLQLQTHWIKESYIKGRRKIYQEKTERYEWKMTVEVVIGLKSSEAVIGWKGCKRKR